MAGGAKGIRNCRTAKKMEQYKQAARAAEEQHDAEEDSSPHTRSRTVSRGSASRNRNNQSVQSRATISPLKPETSAKFKANASQITREEQGRRRKRNLESLAEIPETPPPPPYTIGRKRISATPQDNISDDSQTPLQNDSQILPKKRKFFTTPPTDEIDLSPKPVDLPAKYGSAGRVEGDRDTTRQAGAEDSLDALFPSIVSRRFRLTSNRTRTGTGDENLSRGHSGIVESPMVSEDRNPDMVTASSTMLSRLFDSFRNQEVKDIHTHFAQQMSQLTAIENKL